MAPEEIGFIICGIFLGVVIPLFIIAIRKEYKKAPTREQLIAEEDKVFESEPEVTRTHAEVVDMACGVRSVGYQGYKLPRAEKSFIVSFKTNDGEVLAFAVEEEYYGAFDIGQVGTLEMINGELGSFEIDES